MGLMMFLLIGSAIVFPNVGRGMPDTYLLPDDGATRIFFEDVDTGFAGKIPLPLNVLFRRPQLHEKVYRDSLKIYIEKLANRSDAIFPPACWLKDVAERLPYWADEMRVSQTLGVFWRQQEVRENYGWDRVAEWDDTTEAARCHFFLWQPTDPEERTKQALELMDSADNSGLDAIVYHESFPVHVSIWQQGKEYVLQTVGWALFSVLCSLMVLLPARNALLCVFNVAGVLLVLLGFMSVTGVSYNAITYTTCVMAIGFCIDYTCLMLHFATHGVPSGAGWDVRMGHALRECGFDVLLGCATAFIGLFCLSFHNTESFRIISRKVMVMVSVGGLFALWGLPSVMALWSRCVKSACGTKPRPDDKCQVPQK
eukprot:TRINITY_DN41472_c0_g1_i1.p1 TRINITY_DN41472_c0_g1~~TRINITY_DN41472_c0_g1_i1.p1  ORF type:complete len:369 (+),score=41.74 TRINITY_DN41472_c0_g1_i1:546-1652(+)